MLDLITKIIAFQILPYNEWIKIAEVEVYLYLTYNFHATGGQAAYVLGEISQANTKLVFSSLMGFSMGVYVWASRKLPLTLKWKILIGFLIYVVLAFSIEVAYKNVRLSFPNHFTSWFTKAGSLFLYGIIFYVLQNKVLKTLIAVTLGCGLGNFINHFYPPYHIIDFIYSDLLFRWLKLGIFNLADILFNMSEIITIAYLLYLAGKKIRLTFIKSISGVKSQI